jgi:hypothetical protein
MKVYAKVMTAGSTMKVEVKQDLGIVFELNGKAFRVYEDNENKICLTSENTEELLIIPRASNSVRLDHQ